MGLLPVPKRAFLLSPLLPNGLATHRAFLKNPRQSLLAPADLVVLAPDDFVVVSFFLGVILSIIALVNGLLSLGSGVDFGAIGGQRLLLWLRGGVLLFVVVELSGLGAVLFLPAQMRQVRVHEW